MTLEELIKTLEGAQEMATEGEWKRDGLFLTYAKTGNYTAGAGLEGNAQAIAVRHNTAEDVLTWLNTWNDMSGAADNVEAERNEWKDRANKAEAEVEILKEQIERERDLDLKIMARMENDR